MRDILGESVCLTELAVGVVASTSGLGSWSEVKVHRREVRALACHLRQPLRSLARHPCIILQASPAKQKYMPKATSSKRISRGERLGLVTFQPSEMRNSTSICESRLSFCIIASAAPNRKTP